MSDSKVLKAVKYSRNSWKNAVKFKLQKNLCMTYTMQNNVDKAQIEETCSILTPLPLNFSI